MPSNSLPLPIPDFSASFWQQANVVNCLFAITNKLSDCYICRMLSFPEKLLSFLLAIPVHFYRYAISPLLRPSCRHVPTCSGYALDALGRHGPFRGSVMAANRILRCRPGGTHGYDPVPLVWVRRYRPFYFFLKRYPTSNRLRRF